MVQLSIGTVYAWSVFNNPLCREIGVVAPSGSLSIFFCLFL